MANHMRPTDEDTAIILRLMANPKITVRAFPQHETALAQAASDDYWRMHSIEYVKMQAKLTVRSLQAFGTRQQYYMHKGVRKERT